MNHYCFNREETHAILTEMVAGREPQMEGQAGRSWVRSESYDIEVTLLAYFLCQSAERLAKEHKPERLTEALRVMYEMPMSRFLRLEGFQESFIDLMFSYPHDKSLALEDLLVVMTDRLQDHTYGRALRR